jgi:dTDP-6-deoxy-L-talose 4-dehydrogenase (NAD+)
MKIALTGATGFVGRQILHALIRKNITVCALVRDETRLEPSALGYDNVEVVLVEDIFSEEPSRLAKNLAGVDTLIHAAWYVDQSDYLNSTKNIDCLNGTIDLARAFSHAGGRRFVGIGTCAEYATSSDLITVATPLEPSNLYAACKASAFQVLTELSKLQRFSFSWCRLFYLYGDGEKSGRLVPYLRNQLCNGLEVELSSGNQVRDWLEVSAAADLIVETALSNRQGAFNVCSGIGVSVRDFATRVADEYGRADLLRFGRRPENRFDPPYVVARRVEP